MLEFSSEQPGSSAAASSICAEQILTLFSVWTSSDLNVLSKDNLRKWFMMLLSIFAIAWWSITSPHFRLWNDAGFFGFALPKWLSREVWIMAAECCGRKPTSRPKKSESGSGDGSWIWLLLSYQLQKLFRWFSLVAFDLGTKKWSISI